MYPLRRFAAATTRIGLLIAVLIVAIVSIREGFKALDSSDPKLASGRKTKRAALRSTIPEKFDPMLEGRNIPSTNMKVTNCSSNTDGLTVVTTLLSTSTGSIVVITTTVYETPSPLLSTVTVYELYDWDPEPVMYNSPPPMTTAVSSASSPTCDMRNLSELVTTSASSSLARPQYTAEFPLPPKPRCRETLTTHVTKFDCVQIMATFTINFNPFPTPCAAPQNPCPNAGYSCKECPGGWFCPPFQTPAMPCPCGYGWHCAECASGWFCASCPAGGYGTASQTLWSTILTYPSATSYQLVCASGTPTDRYGNCITSNSLVSASNGLATPISSPSPGNPGGYGSSQAVSSPVNSPSPCSSTATYGLGLSRSTLAIASLQDSPSSSTPTGSAGATTISITTELSDGRINTLHTSFDSGSFPSSSVLLVTSSSPELSGSTHAGYVGESSSSTVPAPCDGVAVSSNDSLGYQSPTVSSSVLVGNGSTAATTSLSIADSPSNFPSSSGVIPNTGSALSPSYMIATSAALSAFRGTDFSNSQVASTNPSVTLSFSSININGTSSFFSSSSGGSAISPTSTVERAPTTSGVSSGIVIGNIETTPLLSDIGVSLSSSISYLNTLTTLDVTTTDPSVLFSGSVASADGSSDVATSLTQDRTSPGSSRGQGSMFTDSISSIPIHGRVSSIMPTTSSSLTINEHSNPAYGGPFATPTPVNTNTVYPLSSSTPTVVTSAIPIDVTSFKNILSSVVGKVGSVGSDIIAEETRLALLQSLINDAAIIIGGLSPPSPSVGGGLPIGPSLVIETSSIGGAGDSAVTTLPGSTLPAVGGPEISSVAASLAGEVTPIPGSVENSASGNAIGGTGSLIHGLPVSAMVNTIPILGRGPERVSRDKEVGKLRRRKGDFQDPELLTMQELCQEDPQDPTCELRLKDVFHFEGAFPNH